MTMVEILQTLRRKQCRLQKGISLYIAGQVQWSWISCCQEHSVTSMDMMELRVQNFIEGNIITMDRPDM